MKKIMIKVAYFAAPVLMVAGMLLILGTFRYVEKPSHKDMQVIEKFYESSGKRQQ